jgi:drug/metabolite transporter (DMT)-like permease
VTRLDRPVPAVADAPSDVRPAARTWLPAYVALSTIWGSSFLFIKIGVAELAPVHVSLARCALGALTLLAFVAVTRSALPSGRRAWGHLAVAALLLNATPFTLFAVGEQHVSSALAGIWNATTPLLTLLVAMVALPAERPTGVKVLGLGVGFAGVVVVLGPWRDLGGSELWGNLACLGAAACYGLGLPYARRFLSGRQESAAVLSAAQLLVASGMLTLVAALTTPMPTEIPSGRVLASMAVLGALGTGLAYVLAYRVIRAVGATAASTVTYVIPFIATVAGVAVLGEALTWNVPVGGAVVLAGVAVSENPFEGLGRRLRRERR